jgi:hypothetical protein
MKPATEYLLKVDTDIAATEFESFCAQGLSLSSLVSVKRHKSSTALVQFKLDLIASGGFEIARIEFKPAPSGQSYLALNTRFDRVGPDLGGISDPVSGALFCDFVLHLGERGYLAGGDERARGDRMHFLADLEKRQERLPGYAAHIRAKHLKETESLPLETEDPLSAAVAGLREMTQEIELGHVVELINTLDWYIAEYRPPAPRVPEKQAAGEPKPNQLSYVESKILAEVNRLRAAGVTPTDEMVAARLPLGPKGRSYSRETVNRYRRRMRTRGIDV